MCPPYFWANPQVRPYENIENYTRDTTLDYWGLPDLWGESPGKKGVGRTNKTG